MSAGRMIGRGLPPSNLGLRATKLLMSFTMLEQWNKTPHDLGFEWDQVDPCWQQAMLIIKGAIEQEKGIAARTGGGGGRTPRGMR